jgi:hypothetical protein
MTDDVSQSHTSHEAHQGVDSHYEGPDRREAARRHHALSDSSAHIPSQGDKRVRPDRRQG